MPLFVSDCHLSNDAPQICQRFLQLLATEAPKASALYVLGDLFDYWVGDDHLDETAEKVAAAFRKLSVSTPIYFMAGNRDFLIGKQYCQYAKIQTIPDPSVINLNGKRILLSHGDRYCCADKAFMLYRNISRSALIRRLFSALPYQRREQLALRLQQQSKKSNQRKSLEVMDVDGAAIMQAMGQHKVDVMIHGHTHRPAVHEWHDHQITRKRYVLGAWEHNAEILNWGEENCPILISYPNN